MAADRVHAGGAIGRQRRDGARFRDRKGAAEVEHAGLDAGRLEVPEQACRIRNRLVLLRRVTLLRADVWRETPQGTKPRPRGAAQQVGSHGREKWFAQAQTAGFKFLDYIRDYRNGT